jgi:hypothetical protein
MPLDAYAVLSAPTILPKTAPDIFRVNVNRNLFRPLTAVKSIETLSPLRDGCQIGRHFYFAIHFLKYWRVELFLMEQLHFRNTQSVAAFAYSMDPFWPLSVLAEKKAKLQLDVLKLCGNFGAGDRDRTRDVQLGNFLMKKMFSFFVTRADAVFFALELFF